MSSAQKKSMQETDSLNALSKQKLSEFLTSLQTWTEKIRAGELTARMPVYDQIHIKELCHDINFVSEMLGSLSRDAELQLQRHTEHIAQKNKSLETLYDVVTSINMTRDVQTLLTQFLHTMTELANAYSAAVYIEEDEDNFTLIAEMGIGAMFNQRHPILPKNLVENETQQNIPVSVIPCSQEISSQYFDNKPLSILIVP